MFIMSFDHLNQIIVKGSHWLGLITTIFVNKTICITLERKWYNVFEYCRRFHKGPTTLLFRGGPQGVICVSPETENNFFFYFFEHEKSVLFVYISKTYWKIPCHIFFGHFTGQLIFLLNLASKCLFQKKTQLPPPKSWMVVFETYDKSVNFLQLLHF